MRTAISVVVGYIVWTALWLAGNAALKSAGILPGDTSQPIQAPMPLCMLLVVATICSVAAGCVAAVLTRKSQAVGAIILAVLLLGTGIAVQTSIWHLMPLWYHITFLGLLAPVTFLGSMIQRRRHA